MAEGDPFASNDNRAETTYHLAVEAALQALATRCAFLISMTGCDPTPDLVDLALEGTPVAVTAAGRRRISDIVMAMDQRARVLQRVTGGLAP